MGSLLLLTFKELDKSKLLSRWLSGTGCCLLGSLFLTLNEFSESKLLRWSNPRDFLRTSLLWGCVHDLIVPCLSLRLRDGFEFLCGGLISSFIPRVARFGEIVGGILLDLAEITGDGLLMVILLLNLKAVRSKFQFLSRSCFDGEIFVERRCILELDLLYCLEST